MVVLNFLLYVQEVKIVKVTLTRRRRYV